MITFLILFALVLLAAAYLRIVNRWRAIKSPRLGILDLTVGGAAVLITADKAALRDVFPLLEESSCGVPHCDVLFLYADFSQEGRVKGYARGLREIIRDSGAKVVVVASENSQDSCTKAGTRKSYGLANLVITFARRGEAFPRFFGKLFARMQKGMSMPEAWVQLAPQVPNNEHPDCPITIFLCEAGHVRFR
jgi:hypothetical protein